MHRCLRPHALPARARCVPNFLSLNRLSFAPWRPISPWRSYTTALEESRNNDTRQVFDSFARTADNGADASLEVPSDSRVEEQEDGDAFDFILEGYESQLTPTASEQREKRMSQTFARYDAHLRKKSIPRQDKKQTPRRRAKAPPRMGDKHFQPRKARIPKPQRLEHALAKAPPLPRLWGRPRYVSATTMGQYSMYALSRVWNYNYARAQNYYDKRQSHQTRKALAPLLDPHAAEWVELVMRSMAEKRDMNFRGLATTHGMDESAIWAHIALWMLHYDKDCLVEFLLATSQSASPGPWVADCLQVLAAHYTSAPSGDIAERVSKLIKIFCALSENPSGKDAMFDGRFVRMVLPYSTTSQMLDMHLAIKAGRFKVHDNTLMHLTSYLAKHDHFHQALDVLLDAHHNGASTHTYQFRSNCSTLLRKSMNLPGGLRVCLRIVDNMAKIGVNLNTRLCNIIILNAVEAGDSKTAFDIYQSLLDHKMKPDIYTHALLLKACKLNIDDAEALNHTIANTINALDISKHPVIATELLHCLVLHHTRNSGEQAWPAVCQAYAKMFQLEPLLTFGLRVPNELKASAEDEGSLLYPPVQALGIMLQARLQLTSDGHGSFRPTRALYQRYRTLVHDRTEPFASTAQTTHCYNAFLRAFTKHAKTLVHAAEVIKDMQNGSENAPPSSAAPDVQSWSIFLEGFTRHGQLQLAEQVLTYMRSKGLEPNQVTWNTLMSGYAKQQDFDGLLDVFNRMEASGHAWDEWTYRGLRRFRNSQRLQDALERKGKEVRLDFTDDLKKGLQERLRGAANQ